MFIKLPTKHIKDCQEFHAGLNTLMYHAATNGGIGLVGTRPMNVDENRECTDPEWLVLAWSGFIKEIELLIGLGLKPTPRWRLKAFHTWAIGILDSKLKELE